MWINRTNARTRENEHLVYFPFPQKKTLKILLHTNPSDFTSNFKPHTILTLVYIETKNTFQIGEIFQTPPQVAT
jgi:hypothetical protein